MPFTVGREKMDLLADFPGVLQDECLGLGLAGWDGFRGKHWCCSHSLPCSEGREVPQRAHPSKAELLRTSGSILLSLTVQVFPSGIHTPLVPPSFCRWLWMCLSK